jgi:hypothetical protein
MYFLVVGTVLHMTTKREKCVNATGRERGGSSCAREAAVGTGDTGGSFARWQGLRNTLAAALHLPIADLSTGLSNDALISSSSHRDTKPIVVELPIDTGSHHGAQFKNETKTTDLLYTQTFPLTSAAPDSWKYWKRLLLPPCALDTGHQQVGLYT